MKRTRWLLGIGGFVAVITMLMIQLGPAEGASLLTGSAAAAPLSSQRAAVLSDEMGSTTPTTPATPTSPPTESPCASCTLTPSPSVQTIPPRPTPPAGTSSLSPGPSTPFVVTPTPFPAALPATGGSQSPPANGMSNWMIAIAGLTIAVALILFAWLYARVTERV
jgi:hypothetical protein